MGNIESRTRVSFSNDGNVAHVDPREINPDHLASLLTGFFESSESSFRISCISDTGTSVHGDDEISQGVDPEEDALFLEHIVRDELCCGEYVTIEKENPRGQELMPPSEF